MKQRQVKAIKNVLFRFEISLKAEKFTTRFGEKRGSGEKRHAECIKTFCLTIFSFFFICGKRKNKFYFMLLQPGKCFSFWRKAINYLHVTCFVVYFVFFSKIVLFE